MIDCLSPKSTGVILRGQTFPMPINFRKSEIGAVQVTIELRGQTVTECLSPKRIVLDCPKNISPKKVHENL